MLSSISISEFVKNCHGNEEIIDIRSIEKFNNNHIPSAKNIPFEKLICEPTKYLEKGKKYYIYCQQGLKSITVCQILKKMGYDTCNLAGGYEKWLLEI